MTAPAAPDPQTLNEIQQLQQLIETIRLPAEGQLPAQNIRMFMPDRVARALHGQGVRVIEGYSNNDSQVAHQETPATTVGQG